MTIIPPSLVPGDEVVVVAPARKVDQSALLTARNMLIRWGFKPRFGEHLFSEDHYFAGTDAERLADLQWAFDDPQAKAILCARGGYGTSRLVDRLSLEGFRSHPKWLVGFSDITALHGWLNNQGFASLHATMPQIMVQEAEHRSAESLRQALGGIRPVLEAPSDSYNRPGTGRGRVVGGNLSMLAHGIGTPSDPQTEGCILFVEDLDEYLYHTDRIMVQLKRAGKLQNLAGLVVGTFSDMKDGPLPFGRKAYEIITSHVQEYDFPVMVGLSVGHVPPNLALPLGMEARLEVTDQGGRLVYG